MSEMNFETMDWEAEAKRLMWAFGVEEECEFVLYEAGEHEYIRDRARHLESKLGNHAIMTSDSVVLTACYKEGSGYYELSEDDDPFGDGTAAEFKKGQPLHICGEIMPRYAEPLARALFRLGLLTPEVEVELEVSLSAHEKMELELERQQRRQL